MTCKFEDLGACAPILGKRVTFGAAASLMATLVVASVGLLFSTPGEAFVERMTTTASNSVASLD